MSTPQFKPDQIRNEAQNVLEDAAAPDFAKDKQKQDLKFKEDEHAIRTVTITRLSRISIAWLLFTAAVVIAQGVKCSCFSLEPSVMIAFLTTSLGTVLGLWGIGLGYYFFVKK